MYLRAASQSWQAARGCKRPVTASHHRLLIAKNIEGKTEAWPKIVCIDIVKLLSFRGKGQCFEIEILQSTIPFAAYGTDIIAEAKIQRQPWMGLPIVLQEK